MSEPLVVGDRVRRRGFEWKEEPIRVGEVTEIYYGQPTVLNRKGLEFIAVRWDDTGLVERGYLQMTASLTKLPTVIAPIGEA